MTLRTEAENNLAAYKQVRNGGRESSGIKPRAAEEGLGMSWASGGAESESVCVNPMCGAVTGIMPMVIKWAPV